MDTAIKLTAELAAHIAGMFKAVPEAALKQDGRLMSVLECAQSGFVVVCDGKPAAVPALLFDAVNQLYGADTSGLNETFHKSFGTVAGMTPGEYLLHQLLHYFTTYGAEAAGVDVPTYVPVEELRLPEGMLPINKLTVIRALPDDELAKHMDRFAVTTKAPNERQKGAMRLFLPYVTAATESLASFEFQAMAHEFRGTVPENPVSVLRYLIYKTTGETLLIKSPRLIETIREAGESADGTARDILTHAGQTALSEVFLRYKPIFLAYKHYPGCAPIVNKLRRLAVRHHKPLTDEAFQNIIRLALEGRAGAVERLLNRAENRDLVKLANAVLLRLFALRETPGVYAIRNGRVFVRAGALRPANTMDDGAAETLSALFNKVWELLAERLRPSLAGKTFFIPKYINYAVPYTEKQMMGHIPYGTRITAELDGAFTVGIHWVNEQGERTDIDLHMRSKTQHFGWNSGFRLDDKIIFTGDQTDAPEPNGAAEAFYFEPAEDDIYILSANQYAGPERAKFEFVVTTQKPMEADIRERSFTYDPAKIAFAPVPLQFNDGKDMSIGMFIGRSLYIYGGALGDGIVPSENSGDLIDGIRHMLENRSGLADVLRAAGANVVDDMGELPDGVAAGSVIDLSPRSVTSSLLSSLIDGTCGGADA